MYINNHSQGRKFFFTLCIVYFSCAQVHSSRCHREYQNQATNEYDVLLPRNTRNGNPTVSDLLRESKTGKQAIRNLVDHFESTRQIYSALNQSTIGSFCNLVIDPRLKRRSLYYNFGNPFNCGYEFENADYLNSVFVTEAVQNLVDALEEVSPRVRESYGIKWKDIFINDIADVKMKSWDIRSCRTYRTMSIWFNNTWSIATKFQKHPWNHYAATMDKEVLTEYVVYADGNLRTLVMNMPKCDTERNQIGNYNSSTASIWYGSKHDDWAWFWTKYYKISYEDHPALKESKYASNYPSEIVVDSGSISGASILIMPVVITLIPIGLFQRVSARYLILYALVTDVFACLPVLIKGIEILTIGYKQYYGRMHSKMYGSAEPGQLLFGQTWTAKCTMRTHIRGTGWVFTAIGIAGIVFGLTLELSVCILMRRATARFEAEKETLLLQDKSLEKIEESSKNAGLLWYWTKTGKSLKT